MISILFNLLRLVLWSRISSILQKDLSLKKLSIKSKWLIDLSFMNFSLYQLYHLLRVEF